MKTNAFIAEHSGGLKECLESERPVPLKTAAILIASGLYEFYTYDKRIEAARFIITDMEHNYNLPTWIHLYKEEK